MKVQKKETRKQHGKRIHEEYMEYHGCGVWRQEERVRIKNSGQFEHHCDFCGKGGLPTFHGKMLPCTHPGYWMEYQCVVCRYHCHSPMKAKLHRATQGHHVKLVDIYWRSERNELH